VPSPGEDEKLGLHMLNCVCERANNAIVQRVARGGIIDGQPQLVLLECGVKTGVFRAFFRAHNPKDTCETVERNAFRLMGVARIPSPLNFWQESVAATSYP